MYENISDNYASLLHLLQSFDLRWDVSSSGAYELKLADGLSVWAWNERNNKSCNWRVWATKFDEAESTYTDLPAEIKTAARAAAINDPEKHQAMAIAFTTAAEKVLAQLGLESSLIVKKKKAAPAKSSSRPAMSTKAAKRKASKKAKAEADPRRLPTDSDDDAREPCDTCGTRFGGRNPSGKVERSKGKCQSCYNKFRREAAKAAAK
jgi:hypothetical protein